MWGVESARVGDVESLPRRLKNLCLQYFAHEDARPRQLLASRKPAVKVGKDRVVAASAQSAQLS